MYMMNGNKEAGSLFKQFQEHNGDSLGVNDDAVKLQGDMEGSISLIWISSVSCHKSLP